VYFEDDHGTTLIARYENFTHNMNVYVRVTEPDMNDYSPEPRHSMSPRRARLEPPLQMLPPGANQTHSSRADCHAPQRPSKSPPPGRGRRSTSASANVTKPRTRPLPKSRGSSSHGSFADGHGDAAMFSDSDGGNASVTSSRRGRKEQVASADISLDNIVEGGRRKRAKFDSSVGSLIFSNVWSFVTSNLTSNIGASFVCATASPDDSFNLICLAPATHK
jgi:hypothetical protein